VIFPVKNPGKPILGRHCPARRAVLKYCGRGMRPEHTEQTDMELKNVRTRFAPSPTGMLHFGNANTALFNWLVARRYGGCVVLRIEDTDLDRSTDSFEKKIIDDLKWLGIDWDEGPGAAGDFGPYNQMQRTDIYKEYLNKLLESGAAYRCYCTKEDIEKERELARHTKGALHYSGKCSALTPADWGKLDAEGKPHTIRFKTPKHEKVVVNDLIRGPIEFMTEELDDFIIIRSNGVPIFLLTNAIDDALMKITHVVRGEDHISNTPKQLLINRALGLGVPEYLHTSMILSPDRTKLSKRHGAVSVFQFRDLGYLPEALVNYLAFLGWNPKDEREFFSLENLVSEFSIEAMGKAPSVFDYDRLKYLNAYWMKTVDRKRVVDLCVKFIVEKGWLTEEEAKTKYEFITRVVEIAGERLKTPADLETNASFFFLEVTGYEEKGAKDHFRPEGAADNLRLIRDGLAKLDTFSHESIEGAMRRLKDEKGLSSKKLIHPTRLSLTGGTIGPGLFELMELLGKEKCLDRMGKAIEWIEASRAGQSG
jgi:glutamyl-tRNA synthetase